MRLVVSQSRGISLSSRAEYAGLKPGATSIAAHETDALMRLAVLAGVFVLFGTAPGVGSVKLPALIGDNMVLQQGREVRIWGRRRRVKKLRSGWAKKGRRLPRILPGGGNWNWGR